MTKNFTATESDLNNRLDLLLDSAVKHLSTFEERSEHFYQARSMVWQIEAMLERLQLVNSIDVTKYEAKAGDEDSFSNLD